MMMDVICSSEMSVLTRATMRNIPEDYIVQKDTITMDDHGKDVMNM
jgi:hypothetical protein